ncbi:MAG: hypothetical protein MUE97_01535 [Phycisphaerales bacterium]|jgi:hypothetical protein|nr:hypothetical protein [Phycisphaerales bacterium]
MSSSVPATCATGWRRLATCATIALVAACAGVVVKADGAQAAEPPAFERMMIAQRAGITTADLPSGVRVHVRPMGTADGPDRQPVRIAVLLAGTELAEPPDGRGLSMLAAAALEAPSGWTLRHTPEGWTLTSELAMSPAGGGESMDTLQGAALGKRLGSLAAWLAAGDEQVLIDDARFATGQRAVLGQLAPEVGGGGGGEAPRGASPDRQVAHALLRAMTPTDSAQARPPTRASVMGLTRERAEAFARGQMRQRAMDVVIVGPIGHAAALDAARRALAPVGPRQREAMLDQRMLARVEPRDDRERLTILPGTLPEGQVLIVLSFPAPAQRDLRQSRLALIAAKVLQAELRTALAERGIRPGLVVTGVVPGRTFPNLGVSTGTIMAPIARDAVPGVVEALHAHLAKLWREGPTVAVMTEARAAAISEIEPRLARADYWLGAIPSAWFLDVPLDELGTAPAAMGAMRSGDLREYVGQWWTPQRGRTLVVIAEPKGAGPSEPAGPTVEPGPRGPVGPVGP